MSSPPTRGCSVLGGGVAAAVAVLPADAGVFRPSTTRPAPRPSPPRRRGGVPVAAVIRLLADASSPPTRGCSVVRPHLWRGHGVLPADAGVFLWAVHGRRAEYGPPRRRGGVPYPSSARAVAHW